MGPVEGLVGKLAERWSAAVIAPAFLFWVGAFAAWVWSHGGISAVDGVDQWLTHRSSSIQALVVAGALLGVVASANVVQIISTPLIRLLEGFWPWELAPLRRRLVGWQAARYRRIRRDWERLATSATDESAPPAERARFARLDGRLHRYPPQKHPDEPSDLMPSRVGNALRAAELRCSSRYGLDPTAVWPYLWLVLPVGAKQDLSTARERLDVTMAACFWSILFIGWTVWAWWAAPAALLAVLLTYRIAVAAGETYADLIESAFAVHRANLYRMLRWPTPKNAAREPASGMELTRYLWRGSHAASPEFTSSEPPGQPGPDSS